MRVLDIPVLKHQKLNRAATYTQSHAQIVPPCCGQKHTVESHGRVQVYTCCKKTHTQFICFNCCCYVWVTGKHTCSCTGKPHSAARIAHIVHVVEWHEWRPQLRCVQPVTYLCQRSITHSISLSVSPTLSDWHIHLHSFSLKHPHACAGRLMCLFIDEHTHACVGDHRMLSRHKQLRERRGVCVCVCTRKPSCSEGKKSWGFCAVAAQISRHSLGIFTPLMFEVIDCGGISKNRENKLSTDESEAATFCSEEFCHWSSGTVRQIKSQSASQFQCVPLCSRKELPWWNIIRAIVV